MKAEGAAPARAEGAFDVQRTPLAEAVGGLERAAISKIYTGDLAGGSQGEMLSVIDAAAGSGGYVALERVTATLGGRRGGFVLQHSGTRSHGAQSLAVQVVPGSATGALAGLAGTMTIRLEAGVHRYRFDYGFEA
ncbi:DUF3224 domain-containing protein [Sphingomonas morindae]|uniref:DUF3224 domain-containing protein n=1 Tax=Sphingomonas morindae TaxID=1541170 RepID=A0ABY4X5D2_9SPHN|nr:DUF3224 domain-containing protein [Sphingomonas morindae]USI72094.1 DUF3224 domain-containing protein [Sphingomonas morindae]